MIVDGLKGRGTQRTLVMNRNMIYQACMALDLFGRKGVFAIPWWVTGAILCCHNFSAKVKATAFFLNGLDMVVNP